MRKVITTVAIALGLIACVNESQKKRSQQKTKQLWQQ